MRRRARALVLALVLLSTLAGPALAYTATQGTVIGVAGGPTVTLGATLDLANGNPTDTATGTVWINTTGGSDVRFQSNVDTEATIDALTGSYTNVSAVNVTGGDLTIDPSDKERVVIGGGVTALDFASPTANDGTPDFIFDASGAWNITVRGLSPSTTYLAHDGSSLLDTATTDGSGVATFHLSSGTGTAVQLRSAHAPALDAASMTPTGELTSDSLTMELGVNDSDFPISDTATVNFSIDGAQVGQDTLTANGTASYTQTSLDGGSHTWSATVTDAYGLTDSVSPVSFSVPDVLQVRNETNVSQVIKGKTIHATFYATDGVPIADRTTTTGNISLTGLPVGDSFVVVVNVSHYHQRTIYIDNLFDQADIFLLNTSAPQAQTVFQVTDNTGNFPVAQSIIKVQRALNRSKFDPTLTGMRWTTVTGEKLGADGSHTSHLEKFARYRVVVENANGDQSILGEFVAEYDSTRSFQIGKRVFDFTDHKSGVRYGSAYSTVNGTKYVRFSLSDVNTSTSDVQISIHERGNASNEIYNATQSGPYGTLSVSQPLSGSEVDKEWVVDWQATNPNANDGSLGSTYVVGKSQRPLDIGGQPVQTAVAVLVLLLTFFMTSAGINRYIGGLITPMMGALLWYLGFMPAKVGAGVVIFALFIGGAYYASSSRAGGF